MKITIFIIVPVWKSNETGKFDISDYHSLFEDVHNSASEMTDIVSGGALNSTHSLTHVRPQLSHKLEVFW